MIELKTLSDEIPRSFGNNLFEENKSHLNQSCNDFSTRITSPVARSAKALSQKKFNTLTKEKVTIRVQLRTGFDENMYSIEQKRKANLEWSKGKVYGCPIRVKSM